MRLNSFVAILSLAHSTSRQEEYLFVATIPGVASALEGNRAPVELFILLVLIFRSSLLSWTTHIPSSQKVSFITSYRIAILLANKLSLMLKINLKRNAWYILPFKNTTKAISRGEGSRSLEMARY